MFRAEQSGSSQEELNVDEPTGNKRKTNSTHNIVDVRVVPTRSIYFVFVLPFWLYGGIRDGPFSSADTIQGEKMKKGAKLSRTFIVEQLTIARRSTIFSTSPSNSIVVDKFWIALIICPGKSVKIKT
jgi:hypothetical protein